MEATRTTWGHETLFPLSHLADNGPKCAPRIPDLPVNRSFQTWHRWAKRGWRVGNRYHKLPTILVASVRHTSVEAVREFFSAMGEHVPVKESSEGQGGRVNKIPEGKRR